MAKRKVAGTLRVPSADLVADPLSQSSDSGSTSRRDVAGTRAPLIGGLVWRAVEHELPDSEINVLIIGPEMNGEPFIGYYDDGEKNWVTVYGSRVQVTHWMDLPQPPGTWFEQAECLTWSIAELARSKQVRSRIDMDDIADDLRELADKIDEIDLESGE
jgi:hypothetical protein